MLRILLCSLLAVALSEATRKDAYFQIRVVDEDMPKQGVPLVQLRTTAFVTLHTDSAGVAAFYVPGWMDTEVFFSVLADGYKFNQPNTSEPPYADPGAILFTESGGSVTLQVQRVQPASRMFRLTGAGLYKDSGLTSSPVPIPDGEGLNRAGILGQDTVMLQVFKNKVYYFFGDTECSWSSRADNCNATGMHTVGATAAVSPIVPSSAPHPVLSYFTAPRLSARKDSRSPLPMAPIEPLDRNTWTNAVSVFGRGTPAEAMFAMFFKPGSVAGQAAMLGWMKWDENTSQFRLVSHWPNDSHMAWLHNAASTVLLAGPSAEHAVDDLVYLSRPFVHVRLSRAAAESGDDQAFEVYTPLATNSTPERPVLDPKGWGWRQNMSVFGQEEEALLLAQGLLPRSMARYQTTDMATGDPIVLSSGSVNYHNALGRWVLIGEAFPRGEQWVGTATSLTGPWGKLLKVATHNVTGASCYGTNSLPFLSQPVHLDADSDTNATDYQVYLSCSYTAMWSDTLRSRHGRRSGDGTSQWYACLFGAANPGDCMHVVPEYEYNNLIYGVAARHLKAAGLLDS